MSRRSPADPPTDRGRIAALDARIWRLVEVTRDVRGHAVFFTFARGHSIVALERRGPR